MGSRESVGYGSKAERYSGGVSIREKGCDRHGDCRSLVKARCE
jgi:hypothetical protein